MKNLLILLCFFSTTAFGQVYDSAGFIKVKHIEKIVYRDTGSTKIIYQDTGSTKIVYRDTGSVKIIYNDTGSIRYVDTCITQPPVDPEVGSTYSFSFTQIPITDPDIISPGRGAEQWHNSSARIPNPTESQPIGVENSLDVYYRGQWTQIEGSTAGSYNWSWFDGLVSGAIDKGQKLSFGIMTETPGSEQGHTTYGGAKSSYPVYLHNLMQSESANNRDFIAGDYWVPNYNSPHYITALRNLHTAIKNRLLNTTYIPSTGPNAGKLVLFANAIGQIDIRGFGSWGEWHTGSGVGVWSNYPTGRAPTVATFKAIINAHTQIFDRWPLVIMIAAFDGGGTFIPLFQPYPEVAHYAATATNAWGQVGWRKDQYGATDGYLAGLLENNNVTWNGSTQLKNILMNTWKEAPITGEPPSWTVDGPDLMRQVTTYHTTSFGNGNYGAYPNITLRNQIRDAFKKCGYRLIVEEGKAVTTGTTVAITLNWKNVGISPTYENWDVVFEAVSSTGVVANLGTSSFKPKWFLPSTQATVFTDTFLENLSGQYTLRVTLKDPTGYRQPGVLAINGRQANGTYILGTVNL